MNVFNCIGGVVNKISPYELECVKPDGSKIIRYKSKYYSPDYGIDVLRVKHKGINYEFEFQAMIELHYYKKLVDLLKFNYDELPEKVEIDYRSGGKGLWRKRTIRHLLEHPIHNYDEYLKNYEKYGIFKHD